jgi:hypothetical protein
LQPGKATEEQGKDNVDGGQNRGSFHGIGKEKYTHRIVPDSRGALNLLPDSNFPLSNVRSRANYRSLDPKGLSRLWQKHP